MNAPIVHEPFQFTIPLGFTQLQITGFGIAVMLAFLISLYITERELARRGQVAESLGSSDVLLAAMIGTLVGAKLYYHAVVLRSFEGIMSRGGFVYWGGFIGAVIACWLVIRAKKLSFARYADVAGLAIPAGYAVGRTGCWAVGDDYGKPWDGPLATMFPNGAPPSTAAELQRSFGIAMEPGLDPATVIAVFPSQLLHVALGMAMFFIAWRLRMHRHAAGWLFGLYCLMAGIERFIVEFTRAKDDRFWSSVPLSTAQFIAIAIGVIGIAIMAARRQPAPLTPAST
jgi:phosphatidylglycerol---prolipoprotein diacylglyceryl transferase